MRLNGRALPGAAVSVVYESDLEGPVTSGLAQRSPTAAAAAAANAQGVPDLAARDVGLDGTTIQDAGGFSRRTGHLLIYPDRRARQRAV